MDTAGLSRLLEAVRDGAIAPDAALTELRRMPFADLGFALVDHHRHVRQGMPEAVYGPGKTPEQVTAIVGELLSVGDGPVVVTRATVAQAQAALTAHPAGCQTGTTLVWRPAMRERVERVVVATAGTADLPVADECSTVLAAYGFSVRNVNDVGVAGVHRLLAHIDTIQNADVVVVIAGMEGALASVVGGLTSAPVIAVPTSVGYGSSFEGITALLAMLSSCASGVTVVGIDNGFGAACAVARLAGPQP